MYCNANILKSIDNKKEQINILESATNKLIQADPMINKKPKVNLIRDDFKVLFKEEETDKNKINKIKAMMSSLS